MSSNDLKFAKMNMRDEDKVRRSFFYIDLACDIQLSVLSATLALWVFSIISSSMTFITVTCFIVLLVSSAGVGLNVFKLLRRKRL